MKPEYPVDSWYNDRVVKYTINIPIPLYNEARRRAKRIGMYHLSVYIRAILEKELAREKPSTISQIVEQTEKYQYLDPPRRYHGFIGGLTRSLGAFIWFRKRKEKILDSEFKRQYTFFK